MKTIPTCFFPTKVLLLDDDTEFLKQLKDILDTSMSTYQTFSKPYEALSYIQKISEKESYLDTWIKQSYSHIKEDKYEGWKQIYSTKRFDQVSTLIIDYMMPGVNGLEICDQIKNPHIQKIMLTGEAEESIAIKAFNEGLIHAFVRKDEPRVFNTLNNLIHKRQTEFFISLTKGIFEEAKENFYGTLLQEKEFINIFQDILTKFNIVEYYLLDAVGKFILVDKTGNVSALYAYNQEEFLRNPCMEAEGYFVNGLDFTFPSTPVSHPLDEEKYKIVGMIKGQESTPHHDFPIYKIPNLEGYVWGYVPKLLSPKEVSSFEYYKRNKN